MEPLHFAAQVLDLHGAAVEEMATPHQVAGARASVHALLPGPLAARLGWEEEIVLSGQASAAEDATREIAYGSADLEQLLDLLREDCSIIRMRGKMSWPHSRDLGSEAGNTFRFHTKVRMAYGGTSPSHASYLLVYYALNAVSEEVYEGLVASMVNQSTLSPVPGLATHLEDAKLFSYRESGTGMSGGRSLTDVCKAAHAEASRLAAGRLGRFVSRLERRRKRDAERLHTYYEALTQETRRRKGRGRQRGSVRTEDRLEAIRDEYERKIRDLDVRYALRIRLRPVAAVRVDIPALRGTYHLQWRRAERSLPITWNLPLQAFEPIACDGCGAGGMEMAIDEQLRIRCSDCARDARLGDSPLNRPSNRPRPGTRHCRTDYPPAAPAL